MLRIRAEQFEVFAADARRRFVERASRHARTHWPEEVAARGDDDLEPHILGTLEHSREADWKRESEVLRLLNLTLAFELDADDFFELPWVVACANRSDRAAPDRLDELEAEAQRRLGASGPSPDTKQEAPR